jgi:predicted ATP-grasp superfamily ATP-dependent carboligase
LLLKAKKGLPVSVLFAETHSKLPDSKAAAKIIQILDQYMFLNVDYKPLLKQAEGFEEKLKGLLSKGQQMAKEQEKKRLSYVG